MEKIVKIRKLSSQFYAAYPKESYPEILTKESRPYFCFTVDEYDFVICVPFRSHMGHKNGYSFRKGKDKKKSKRLPGLDYQKIVVLNGPGCISEESILVSNSEYDDVMNNQKRIISECKEYVENYIHHIDGTQKLHDREFSRKYSISSLPYFDTIMGI